MGCSGINVQSSKKNFLLEPSLLNEWIKANSKIKIFCASL